MKNKPHIISIANQKGGVGKTTTALNIAAGLVKVGKKVLCIDFDPQSNLSDYMGFESDGSITISDLMLGAVNNQTLNPTDAIRTNNEGINFIPSNINLSGAELFLAQAMFREQVLKKVLQHEDFQSYDYIIIDCLPSLGILLTNALIASNGIIIPVQAQKFALDGLDKLLEVYHLVKSNANSQLQIDGVLLTMAENTNMSKAVESRLKELFNGTMYDTKIRRSVEATNSTYEQRSLVASKNSKLGEEYINVVKEILVRENNT